MKSARRNNVKKRKAQMMIEYLILYTAVLLVAIAFLGSKTSFFATSYDKTLNKSSNSIVVVVNRILQ